MTATISYNMVSDPFGWGQSDFTSFNSSGDIIGGNLEYTEPGKGETKDLAQIKYNSETAPFFEAVVNNDYDTMITWLIDNEYIDSVFAGTHLKVTLDNISIPAIKQGSAPEKKSLILASKLLKYPVNGTPVKIPYTNFSLNDSGDENCFVHYAKKHWEKSISAKSIERFFLGGTTNTNNIKRKVEGRGVNLESIIDFAVKYKIPTKLVDINGKLIYTHFPEVKSSRRHMLAMIANNHIYPFINTKSNAPLNPKLISDKMDNTMILTPNEDKCVVATINNKIYTPTGWYFKKEEHINENLDISLFKRLPLNFSYGNAPKCLAIIMSASTIPEDKVYSYDMRDCYPNIFYKSIPDDFKVGVWCCFDIWEEYNGDDIRQESQYLLDDIDLTAYGITTNFHLGFLIQLLLDRNVIKKANIVGINRPYHYVNFGRIREITEIDLKNLIAASNEKEFDEIEDASEYKEYKQLRVYNGVLGRTKVFSQTLFEGVAEDDIDLLNIPPCGLNHPEREYEAKHWDAHWKYDDEGNVCETIAKRTVTTVRTLTHVNIYNTIVEYANYFMLKRLFEVRDATGLSPICIKTDALVYDTKIDLLESDKEFRREDKGVFTGNIHQFKYKPLEINEGIFNYFKNLEAVSYHGAPGTGKTYTVKANHEFDVAATTSNMCSLNMTTDKITARTLFSLFNCWQPTAWSKALKNLRGKTLWIDEYSMINRQIWGFIVTAAIQYNAKLILSGDHKQIGPVMESKLSPKDPILSLLFGQRHELTVDYRNNSDLIELRNFIDRNIDDEIALYAKFRGMYLRDDSWIDNERHLSFTNRTAESINYTILKKRHYHWDYYNINGKQHLDASVGVIVVAVHTRKNKKDNIPDIMKGDIWRISDIEGEDESKVYVLENLSRNGTVKYPAKIMAYYFHLGFCTTTHKSQGLTIKDKFTIHDIRLMIRLDPDILYTAVTRGINLTDITFIGNAEYEKSTIRYPKLDADEQDEEDLFEAQTHLKMNK